MSSCLMKSPVGRAMASNRSSAHRDINFCHALSRSFVRACVAQVCVPVVSLRMIGLTQAARKLCECSMNQLVSTCMAIPDRRSNQLLPRTVSQATKD
jgi:hypothetical protein